MPPTTIDLHDVAARLADRRPDRAEANVQADVRMLLLAAGLNLRDGDLHDVTLEAPVGTRRRIDVEVGATVIEVKRDLRVGRVRDEAVEQLAGYVRDRVATVGSRYVGVLTDGVEWLLYHLDGDTLALVSRFDLDARALDVEGLVVWLDGVLATSDRLRPTPREIGRRLGAGSSSHALDVADLSVLYERSRGNPSVALKRQLWAKLLTTALGTTFGDEDSLFVEHTLLVATAEIIGHAVVGIDPTDASVSPATLLAGHLFADAQIRGVVEEDFFDWIVEVDGGPAFVRTLARRLSRFEWVDVEHDVMKVLYESVIAPDTRHRLGEYYTPDWLAAAIVAETVDRPLEQRVLDPSCGSGTFLFQAVRGYLDAAAAQGVALPDAISGVTRNVLGVDVHPVAVTLARVTYLLAIGRERLQADDRPEFSVPVYLGDAVQWGQDNSLINTDALIVPTNDGAQLFADELRFPDRVVEDAGIFDALVSELADIASRPGRGPAVSLAAVFRRHAIHDADQPTITATFKVMCDLHDQGRNHIWGYYIRNLARPLWLSRDDNRVDVLVGNPPWLSYRFMPPGMKASFRSMSDERGFWAGAAAATHQDLSALFVARAAEQYLTPTGKFAFVMPLAALSRTQFAGFRTGKWGAHNTSTVNATFTAAWDLHQVKPSFFPVPGCVVLGHRSPTAVTVTGASEQWAGRITAAHATTEAALGQLTRTGTIAAESLGVASLYGPRFSQGASLVPRFLLFVEAAGDNPLGAGAGRRRVHSYRNSNEKKPWKSLPSLAGTVEKQFLRPTLVGDSVLPFRLRPAREAVIPWDGTDLGKTTSERLDLYPGLAQWWRQASQVWDDYKTSGSSMTLLDQIDYRHKLKDQLPGSPVRVIYTKSGMYLAAAIITDPNMIIDHKLYWAAAASIDEATYLGAVLNSNALLQLIRPLQGRGEHNPRDFDKYVWQAPIPLYDPSDPAHRGLVDIGQRATQIAANVELPAQSFQALRRRVRQAFDAEGLTVEWDTAVTELLTTRS